MAKKIGIIVLLCFSLCVGGVSAFANEGHDETDTQTLIETQPPVSSVLFRQDGADIQQSTDEGKTWQSYSPIEETDYFTYDEFSAWIENETENIQKLVDAGEWTEAEATEALEYYDEILKSILEGKMVGKRASSSDDQLFFSMPDNAQPEQYQTLALPSAVFIYATFIRALPKELDEAAALDGCTGFSTFWRVIFPAIKPATASFIILNGFGIWNNYAQAVFFLQSRSKQNIPQALSVFFQQFGGAKWHLMASTAVIAVIPVIIIFLVFQKQFIQGLTDGALKG